MIHVVSVENDLSSRATRRVKNFFLDEDESVKLVWIGECKPRYSFIDWNQHG